jgi:hypothetical protein
VNVTHDGVDIYDGLSGYFDDVVEFEGEKRRMEVSLVDLPPLLQIQLQVRCLTVSCQSIFLTLYFSESNSIVTLCSPTNHRHM